MLTEHQHISLAQGYVVGGVEVSKFHPRGAWFALAFKSDDVPDGTFTFEAVPLEGEIVQESQKDVFNG